MIDKNRKISYDNRGSALVMALVVSAVLMVLSLSLLAVSYSLFLSQKNNTYGTNERELFYSAIEVFEQELISSGHNDLSTLDSSKFDEEVLNQNGDDFSLLGTQIVDSIYNYCCQVNSNIDNIIPGVEGWECFNVDYYSELDENDKLTYINGKSRFFELTCVGSYDLRLQMYWEIDSNDNEVTSVDFENTLLHIIYYLKKKDDTILKNERVYRIGKTLKAIVENIQEDDDPQQEPDSTVRDYEIQFKTATKKYIQKYNFDKFYSGYYPDYIYLSEAEVTDNGGMNKYFIQDVDSEYKWYITSDCTDNLLWDGTPKQIGIVKGTKSKIARTDWGYVFPVRIRFVINGYILELDAKTFKYNYYVEGQYKGLESEKTPGFYKSDLDGIVSNALLEMCKVNVNQIDNVDSISWVQKVGNTYYPFFDEYGNPQIKNPELLTDFTAYYVYASFPSCYPDGDTDQQPISNSVKNYDKNKVINPYLIASFPNYSFERIIGE